MNFRTKREATAYAEEIRKTMDVPDEWKVEVWLNLDWCWCLTNGPIRVHPALGHGFHTLISDKMNGAHGSPSFWAGNSYSDSAQDSVRKACVYVLDFDYRIQSVVAVCRKEVER